MPLRPRGLRWSSWGFRLISFRQSSDSIEHIQHYKMEMGIPYWLLVIFFSAYPIVAFIRRPARLRRLRRERGLCQDCGYNLTGNVSGVCPECGEKVEAGTATEE